MHMHAAKFSHDIEENKLEYTTIHEGYILIAEEQIDTKLEEKYSKEEIEVFYKTFEDRF